MSWAITIGEIGEQEVQSVLESRDWHVENLNEIANFPNVDLIAKKGQKTRYVQVKTHTRYGYILAGSVNEKVCRREVSIFNRSNKARYKCDFVICLTPAGPQKIKKIPEEWRYFIMPVAIAEEAFFKNVDEYFNGLRLADGKPRSKNGSCQDFVGPYYPINSKVVSDHREDFLPYEGRFDLLDKD